MSYESKLAKARQIILDFSADFDVDKFFTELAKIGATDEDSLKFVTWEDLKTLGLPTIKARQVSEIFRAVPAQDSLTSHVSEKKAANLSVLDLVKAYNPKEYNAVYSRLASLSDGKPCLAYDSSRTLNIEESAKVIQEIIDEEPPRSYIIVDKQLIQLYRIGERPTRTANVDPLFRMQLRSDGKCSRTNLNWGRIDYSIKCLLFLAVDSKEIVVNNNDDAIRIMEVVDKHGHPASWEDLYVRYPIAARKYTELNSENRLPTLKMVIGAYANYGVGQKQDPFYTGVHKRS